jgi:uncharacterized protein YqeY
MPLAEDINAQIKAAMLAKDAQRLGALRLLKSALGYVAIEKKVDLLPDADVLVVIQKEVKKRRDSLAQYEAGGRTDLAAIEQGELAVLETFLPKPLSPEELEALVRAAISEFGATSKNDMGAVMKVATAKAAGRADGKTLSGLVGKLLP